jgi:hypothetical protein
MPKQKQEDVNKLLTNMKGSAAKAQSPQKPRQNTAAPSVKPDALHRYIDLTPYKEHQGWPGRGYLLVGNSYNMERKINEKNKKTKRNANIALLLEQGKNNRHCVTVEDALCHAGFVEALSRFEFDWLRREPPSSLVGPAYDEQGKLLSSSFAVWRVDTVYSKATSQARIETKQTSRELVGAR